MCRTERLVRTSKGRGRGEGGLRPLRRVAAEEGTRFGRGKVVVDGCERREGELLRVGNEGRGDVPRKLARPSTTTPSPTPGSSFSRLTFLIVHIANSAGTSMPSASQLSTRCTSMYAALIAVRMAEPRGKERA